MKKKELEQTVRELALRLDRLEKELKLATPTVEDTLRRRGFACISHSPLEGIALPLLREEKIVREFYQVLKSYFFRRLFAEIIERRNLSGDDCLGIEKTWGRNAVKKYMEKLTSWGIITDSPSGDPSKDCQDYPLPAGSYFFPNPAIRNFGETLEWFVAQVFQREFATPSIWKARLKNFQKGGDFDVLVRFEWFLGYVECKSSPPYNVRLDEQREFLERVEGLKPDFAIFLVDTTLDIKRNILDNMQWLLGMREKLERLEQEVYSTPSKIYIITSKRSLVKNISVCLKDFMRGISL